METERLEPLRHLDEADGQLPAAMPAFVDGKQLPFGDLVGTQKMLRLVGRLEGRGEQREREAEQQRNPHERPRGRDASGEGRREGTTLTRRFIGR